MTPEDIRAMIGEAPVSVWSVDFTLPDKTKCLPAISLDKAIRGNIPGVRSMLAQRCVFARKTDMFSNSHHIFSLALRNLRILNRETNDILYMVSESERQNVRLELGRDGTTNPIVHIDGRRLMRQDNDFPILWLHGKLWHSVSVEGIDEPCGGRLSLVNYHYVYRNLNPLIDVDYVVPRTAMSVITSLLYREDGPALFLRALLPGDLAEALIERFKPFPRVVANVSFRI